MVSLERESYRVEVHCVTKTVLLDLADPSTLKKCAERMMRNWHETLLAELYEIGDYKRDLRQRQLSKKQLILLFYIKRVDF